MNTRIGSIVAIVCIWVLSAALLTACSTSQLSSSADMSDISDASSKSNVGKGEPLSGLYQLVGYEIEDDALEKAYPIEELANEAHWAIEDSIELFMISGSYLEFNEDGTYANYAGQLDTGSKMYKLEKTKEGIWEANDDGTYTLKVDDLTATLTMDKDEPGFFAVKSDDEDIVYSTLYRHEEGKASDVEPAIMPEGIVYSARANVCKAAAKNAILSAKVDDAGTADEADDIITLDIDTTKVGDLWFKNKPYIAIEECEDYPGGLAVKVDKLEIDGDVWHVEGTSPELNNFVLLMNE